jgi:phage terminase large subunit-like protein
MCTADCASDISAERDRCDRFRGAVEKTILEWRDKFQLRKVYFDPFQMVSVAQRLAKQSVKIEEYPQTIPNLTAATSNLFDLIFSRQLILYPDAAMRRCGDAAMRRCGDAAMRLAVSRAIIVESSRGWRLDKLKQQHKIDLVVALSMAALAAVRGQSESSYISDLSWVNGDSDTAASEKTAAREWQEMRMAAHIARYAGGGLRRF